MSVDAKLMQNQTGAADNPADSSAEKAGAMRQAKRDETGKDSNQGPSNLRSSKMQDMRAKAGNFKNNLKNKLSIGQKSLSAATSKLLQAAWRNIIISFGFSFLYIYAHLFLQQIFGKNLFAPLGSEWRDRPGLTIKERERMGVPFKLMESMGVGCLSIVLLIAVIFAFTIPALIVEVVDNPVHAFIKIIWDDVWSFLSR